MKIYFFFVTSFIVKVKPQKIDGMAFYEQQNFNFIIFVH
jgi:hypothetical protein